MRSSIRILLAGTVVPAVVAAALSGVPAGAGTPAPGAAVERAAAPGVTLGVNRATIDAGQPVVLQGKVAPAARGVTVQLQKRLEGRSWVTEKKLRTGANGRYRYVDRPSTAGKRAYRVVVPKQGRRPRATSAAVALTVYAWQDLTKVAVRTTVATSVTTSASINGVTYARALVGRTSYYDEGLVDWNILRRCTDLTVRLGNGDDSDDTATAGLQVLLDGNPAYTGEFELTESTVRRVSLDGVFRLGFAWTSSNTAGTETDQSGAQATMANPRVRCAF